MCSSLTEIPDISNWKIMESFNYQNVLNLIILYKYIKQKIEHFKININDIISSLCKVKYSDNDIHFIQGFGFNYGKKDSIDEIIFSKNESMKPFKDLLNNLINNIDFSNLGPYISTFSFLIEPFLPKPEIHLCCLFSGCSLVKKLPDVSKWNVGSAVNIYGFFSGCSSLLTVPDISNWNIENTYYIRCLFYGCSSLKELPDISNWNTSKVEDMDELFSDCSSLLSIPDISKWNTENVNVQVI